MKVNLRERAEQLKKDVPAVFLALRDKDTPLIAKIFAGMTVVYALSPVDLIPADKLEECRLRTEGMWSDGKPKKWYYAMPIVAI